MLIHEALHINAASTCAFIEYSKLWLVIEQSRHLPTEIHHNSIYHNSVNDNNNNDRLTAFDPGQPG